MCSIVCFTSFSKPVGWVDHLLCIFHYGIMRHHTLSKFLRCLVKLDTDIYILLYFPLSPSSPFLWPKPIKKWHVSDYGKNINFAKPSLSSSPLLFQRIVKSKNKNPHSIGTKPLARSDQRISCSSEPQTARRFRVRMELMSHSSTFLLPPPSSNQTTPSLTYALVVLNQRLPRFSPLLWSHGSYPGPFRFAQCRLLFFLPILIDIVCVFWAAQLRLCADGGANRLYDDMPLLLPHEDASVVRQRFDCFFEAVHACLIMLLEFCLWIIGD